MQFLKNFFNTTSLICLGVSLFCFFIYFMEDNWRVTYFNNIVFSLGVGWFLLFLSCLIYGFDFGEVSDKIDSYPFIVKIVLHFVVSFLMGFTYLATVLYFSVIALGLGIKAVVYILSLIWG
ncbi:MAG: hypothetical protein QXS37_03800 [Candidatus Aenigmatarchaeota archaeon]